ncbi:MAG: arginine repressor [Clostridiales bacterium]|nr:arginine repressor [Clostridiales bacterium]
MKYSRHNKILELIQKHEVETQEELAQLLINSGYHVTQATISRDIKELKLIKIQTHEGKYKYSAETQSYQSITDRFIKVFKDTILSVSHSNNIIVLKTLTGCANAACEAIDALNLNNILGTIAGDNTIFVVVDEKANVQSLVKQFNELIL